MSFLISQVRAILKKDHADRSTEEEQIIKQNKKVVKILEKRVQLRELNRQKSQEVFIRQSDGIVSCICLYPPSFLFENHIIKKRKNFME